MENIGTAPIRTRLQGVSAHLSIPREMYRRAGLYTRNLLRVVQALYLGSDRVRSLLFRRRSRSAKADLLFGTCRYRRSGAHRR